MFQKITGMFAAAALLFGMSSCSDELDLNGGGKGDLVKVSFTITQEGVSLSRGNVYYPTGDDEFPQISDGSKAKRLIWAVYDKNGNLLPELGDNYESKTPAANDVPRGRGQVVENVTEFPHTITLTLVRGQEYSLAFWAQDENCKAFNTDDLRAVTIDYKSDDNKLANDERRDAFCKVETFTVTSAPSMERTIILRRPFAQVNVGIPASEYEALRQSGVRIAKSKIHMENVATEFDVVANSTHGDDPSKRQAIDFEENWIPAYYNWDVTDANQIPTDEALQAGRPENGKKNGKTQDLKIDLDHDGKIAAYGKKNGEGEDARDETYNYMLMAYILPADRNDGTSTYSTTLDKVEFSLLPEDSGQTPLTMSLENVPVQRNWRTNIFGNMFTSEVTLNIDLDPFYAGDYNYPDWQRIYEGVTYDGIEECIRISNGAGLVWLSNATNGVWENEADFKEDKTHNLNPNLTNSSELMLKAAGLTAWPTGGRFHLNGVKIKLDADIDLNTYADVFSKKDRNGDYYFTPIGFGGDAEVSNNLNETDSNGNPVNPKYFGGHFDGQNHTIYNLKTVRPADGNDNSSMGLFSTIGREASIKNVRLKNVDIRGHYRTGGIVGSIYGPINGNEQSVVIDNCYVDGGFIESSSTESGDNGKDVAGIVGIIYNNTTVSNCNVRNLTIRGYRTISGIVGQTGGDNAGLIEIINNKVYNCTLIADWFQYYNKNRDSFEIENIFIGERYWGYDKLDGNVEGDNKVYAFWWRTNKDGKKTTEIGRTELLSNPPLDIFPRLVHYTDTVKFQTSILGGPSAWKDYENEGEHWKGTPVENSGRVGLWVSGLVVDGDQDSNPKTLDNSTITASGLEGENDCVLFVKDWADICNLTFHSDTYIDGQAICLAPASGMTTTLTNVLAYDAKLVLTDDGNGNGGILEATNCNFRGYVKLGKGYDSVTFKETIFDGSTKIYDTTVNKLESGSKVALDGCTFIAPFVIDVPEGSTFEDCYVMINGDESSKVAVTGNMTATIEDNKLVVK